MVKFKVQKQAIVEMVLISALWSVLVWNAPSFFVTTYLPGLGLGLCLCQLQGHYEHVRGTVSHYGCLYNLLFFNDGYHVEHHLRPAEHWTQLPKRKQSGARFSRWPAALRWLELLGLDSLEALVLRSRALQAFVLKKHERAFRIILARLPELRTVGIVGGGMFPRTALILKRLAPAAKLTIVEASGENIRRAKKFLNGDVDFRQQFYDSCDASGLGWELDLLIVPLAFQGDRAAIYRRPPARHVVVHDWLWRRRGLGVVISWMLFKRLNLVQR